MPNANNESTRGQDVTDEERDYPTGDKSPAPVTPKMLVKALKRLQKRTLKGLFFSPRDIACEILRSNPRVEQNFQVLYFEVCDKLSCAAAAGILGHKQDHDGYYAFNPRQNSSTLDNRSELMFWVFYKRLLFKKIRDLRNLMEGTKKEK